MYSSVKFKKRCVRTLWRARFCFSNLRAFGFCYVLGTLLMQMVGGSWAECYWLVMRGRSWFVTLLYLVTFYELQLVTFSTTM
ncbi:hypothetical protein BC832DRAFT_98511 [Gaertneriomyces semiglobifer]|nr:hypothetical protein BC832DRAFT_98511 [Gaertneriomyces semiglobifer]